MVEFEILKTRDKGTHISFSIEYKNAEKEIKNVGITIMKNQMENNQWKKIIAERLDEMVNTPKVNMDKKTFCIKTSTEKIKKEFDME